MGPKAGVDEPLCYSCQDRDEKGICGENVDDSSPLMTKTVCKEGCMVSEYDYELIIISIKYMAI